MIKQNFSLATKVGFFAALLTINLAALPVLAKEDESVILIPPLVSVSAPSTEAVPASLSKVNRLKDVIAKGDRLIKDRLYSLNKMKDRIAKSKLTTEQKMSLNSMIDGQITGLTELQTKIKASTDVKVARELVTSIFTDFRIYAVFIPKVNLLIGLHAQQNHLGKITNWLEKKQKSVDEAKAKGKDVAARQAVLDSAKAQLPAIQGKINDAVSKVGALKPSDYPATSKTVINSLRTAVKDIHQMFVKVRSAWKASYNG